MTFLNISPRAVLSLSVVVIVVFNSPYSRAADFESPQTVATRSILDADLLSSDDHIMADTAINDGYLTVYRLQSKHGELAARSTATLKIRIAELKAMTQMEKVKQSEEFQAAIKSSAGAVVSGAKNLLKSPVGTVKGSFSGIGSMFRSATVGGGSEYEDGKLQQLSGFSKTKRQYANQFGVNPYSRNPLLQAKLNELAQGGFLGSLGFSVGMMAVPGGASIAISVAGNTRSLTEVLVEESPASLRVINSNKLQSFGFSEDLIELYIKNPIFTPAEQTLIVHALEQMSDTANRDRFIKFAILTGNADAAVFRTRQAYMFAQYNKETPLSNFENAGSLVVAKAKDGTYVFCAPLDHLLWTEEISAFVDELDANAKGAQKELVLTGTVSEMSRENLEDRGWRVIEKVAATY
ncbi:MAG: hypothetical protein ACU84Q_20005 [Gammaproteobacteria bacterium]